MGNLDLVETKELVETLEKRFDNFYLLGTTINTIGETCYHRKFVGSNTWALTLPLLAEIDLLKDQMIDAEDADNTIINF